MSALCSWSTIRAETAGFNGRAVRHAYSNLSSTTTCSELLSMTNAILIASD
jgi:hypothetical protein